MADRKLTGVVGFFDGPNAILEGMKKVREANYACFDAFTPFPVHGLEHAQGLKRSPLPWVTFLMGITGTIVAFAFQYWTSVVDWPLIVGGKPFNSWPAFVPVMFELTILFAGVSTVLALILFCRLPNTTKKTFDSALTRDKFAILIENQECTDGKHKNFSAEEAKSLLQNAGAKDVREVYDEPWF